MLLKPTLLDTDRFGISYDKSENCLAADNSDLPYPSRVWDDACDVGYTLRSHRTGREVVYVENYIAKRDGDILYWDFIPACLAVRYRENLPTFRVFND